MLVEILLERWLIFFFISVGLEKLLRLNTFLLSENGELRIPKRLLIRYF